MTSKLCVFLRYLVNVSLQCSVLFSKLSSEVLLCCSVLANCKTYIVSVKGNRNGGSAVIHALILTVAALYSF